MADKKIEKRLIYVRESALQAIISDIFSFGCLLLIMTLNFLYWGGHWYVTIFLLFLWLIFISGRAKAKMQEFYSREEVIKVLQAELDKEKKS